jgi:hypothetical protein
MTPFKNILNKKFIVNSEETNFQPIQSYLQSSLLYDSLFFNEKSKFFLTKKLELRSNSPMKLNCLSEERQFNKQLNESEFFLFYLKELKRAEFWKTYFQSYLKTILKKENIKNQFSSEALALNQKFLSFSTEKEEKFLVTSNLFKKILFES